jgi:1,4-alpha-glucan branching enzyme
VAANRRGQPQPATGATILRKDPAMVSKGSKKGTMRFEFQPPGGARQVMLAGDFNGWQPRKMRKQRGGAFVAVESVPPGRHQYKFLVDGQQWCEDPDCGESEHNPYGTGNSVVRAGD